MGALKRPVEPPEEGVDHPRGKRERRRPCFSKAKKREQCFSQRRATFLSLLDSLVGVAQYLEDVAMVQTRGRLESGRWAPVSGVPPQLEGESLGCPKRILKVSLQLPVD